MKIEGYLHEFKLLYSQLLAIGITINLTYFIETSLMLCLSHVWLFLYKPFLGSCILPPFDAFVGIILHEKKS
jgi:hypothetical protein